jgi:NAD(P)H-dependent FMN reductase
MRVLAFAASNREGSWNRRLIERAAEISARLGAQVDLAEFRAFDMPLYDADLDAKEGLPKGARELCRRLKAADALLLAAPEYNYSIAGTLKNAIDWVSRERPMPWRGKSVYLLSASPSPMGGIRGLWQTRIPLEGCGALVFPDMFSLARADEAFDAAGRLAAKSQARLETELKGFLALVRCLTPVVQRPRSPQGRARQEEIASALEEETALQPPG